MNKIGIDFDEKSLIRNEEISLRWPNNPPPQELIDYWHESLRKWLDEYTGAHVKEDGFAWRMVPKFENPAISIEEGKIVRLNITGGEERYGAFVIPFSRKEKDGEAVWLCCPISPFTVPGTMWEFYGSTKSEDSFVAQAWNIFPIKEDELLKLALCPGDIAKDEFYATEETVKIISHEFELMANYKFQDLPMTSVGPRVFRIGDPRNKYQDDERKKYKPVIAIQQVDKEELKKAIDEKIKESSAGDKQEQSNKE